MAKKETNKKKTAAKTKKQTIKTVDKVEEAKKLTEEINGEIEEVEKELDDLHITGSEEEAATPTINVDFNDDAEEKAEKPDDTENKDIKKPRKSILRNFFGMTWNGISVDY
jgi:hypothetical protein